MLWSQTYHPMGPWLSVLLAAVPIVVLLGCIGFFHVRAHIAALLGLLSAALVAVFAFGMPAGLAVRAAGFGAAYGLLPIGWIVLNIIFLYQLTNERGQFTVLRDSIARISEDSRLQLLVIAFCLGAFFEGAAGFGTPVAVTGAMLIGLGFTRLQASGLSLIANTAPVAFGALGVQTLSLASVTGLPLLDLSATVGRIMTPFCMIVPFWLLVAYCGWRRTLAVWPAALVVGGTYAVAQLAISNLHGPWLASIGPALISLVVLVGFLRVWRPATIMAVNEAKLAKGDTRVPETDVDHVAAHEDAVAITDAPADAASVRKAWMPWLILTALVFIWGIPSIKTLLDGIFRLAVPVPGLDMAIAKVPPVVSAVTPEAAVYVFNPLSATGTAILIAAVVGGLLLGARPGEIVRSYGRAFRTVTPSLLTIAAMLALGYLTRFSGLDTTMGLAFATTGVLYPYFGTMLGWLGTAVTGSDTASNVLFGNLQRVTSEQLGLSPVLMASANSAGGVMGKMIDAQSIVVASTATQWFGQEGRILRYVFVHSIVLGSLIGLVVMLMAYVPPFTYLVVQ
ncbi:L-lactate permease [Sphingomonas sp.]|uniref:L-lactate permease n=1 Tax=Sphingomonas sp. TaxID=28214 RepID=UPI002D19ED66|nr:L-lactate permease [Sphingomonas sp.]HWK35462.1 L-lactate permease [Sphingomonas sp.]